MIVDSILNDKEVEKALERIKDVITRSGGEVLKTENLGVKKLAYRVRKQEKGAYILLVFKSPPTTILELERLYKVFAPVLKFLIVKLKKKEVASVLASLSDESKSTIPA